MIKMNKLALCALLFSGVLSAVNGDPEEVKNLLGFDSFDLFKELKTGSKCNSVLKEVKDCLVKTEDIEKTGQLLYLAGELNSLREFWAWLDGVDPKTLNVEQIFSEDGPEDQDLGADKKLIFLRDVSWGEDVVDEGGNEGLREKCEALRTKCRGFI
ncbi:MAG: hypothetical protein LW808_001950 [Verrucomicrobiota bacterium]|nr:MAG: hypothetical protein LW808_001950 [Verrucomicrobiota bacterium]